MRIAVMAGTVVDTAMGVEFLRQKGLESLGCPISRTAGEQMAFQVLPLEQRMARLRQVFGKLQADGVTAVFVYCNSLSSVADFDGLAAEFSMTVVTPLQCYRAVAAKHDKVAVLAANCQSLAGIEKELYRGNGAVDIFGMAMLPLVQAIEANIPPEDLVEQFALADLLRTFARCGAQCLILGCTHFPYLKDALARLDLLPLFDPAEAMVQRLV